MKSNLWLAVIVLFSYVNGYAMEPQKEPIKREAVNQEVVREVPSLRVLAARKVVHQFDPACEYFKATIRLQSSLPRDLESIICQELARKADDRLEPLLDVHACRALEINTEPLTDNLYVRKEKKVGIMAQGAYIPTPSVDAENLAYELRGVLSPDKSIYVTRPIVFYSSDYSFALWDTKTGNKIKTITIHPNQPEELMNLRCVGISHDNSIIAATVYSDNFFVPINNVCRIKIDTSEILDLSPGFHHGVNHGGTQLVWFRNNMFYVEDFNGNVLYEIPYQKSALVKFPQKDDYIAKNNGNQIEIRDASTGMLQRRLTTQFPIANYCISPSGLRIAGTDSSSVKIWNPYSGEIIADIPHNYGNVLKLGEFFDNDEKLASCTSDLKKDPIQIWDIQQRKLSATKILMHMHQVQVGNCKEWPIVKISFVSNDTMQITKDIFSAPPLLFKLSAALGKELTLKELTALLILEHNRKNGMAAYPNALATMTASRHPLLQKLIAEKRYLNYALSESKNVQKDDFCVVQ